MKREQHDSAPHDLNHSTKNRLSYNQHIELRQYLSSKEIMAIRWLEKECLEKESIALKLELDYKYKSIERDGSLMTMVNEFLYYEDVFLIGYIGICEFGQEPEINGVVAPAYRSQGVFKTLFAYVVEELRKRNTKSVLLLCDRNSVHGQSWIHQLDTQYSHTEYEMYLLQEPSLLRNPSVDEIPTNNLVRLVKATNEDACEIARQNKIYFEQEDGAEEAESDTDLMILPEKEEEHGVTIYLAKVNEQVIGKVHLEVAGTLAGIYGLGVVPEERRKGYGRGIIIESIRLLRELGVEKIKLQVEATNSKALELYQSCGFVETSVMDYYRYFL